MSWFTGKWGERHVQGKLWSTFTHAKLFLFFHSESVLAVCLNQFMRRYCSHVKILPFPMFLQSGIKGFSFRCYVHVPLSFLLFNLVECWYNSTSGSGSIKLHSVSVYLAAIALILIISVLPYLFLVVSSRAGVIAVGENVDGNSRQSTSKFPCFSLFCIFYLVCCWSIPVLKWLNFITQAFNTGQYEVKIKRVCEFHHPGLLVVMVFRSNSLVTTLLVVDD